MECTRKAYFSCGADTAKKIHQTAVERMKAWFPQGCMEVQVLPEFTFFSNYLALQQDYKIYHCNLEIDPCRDRQLSYSYYSCD